MKNTLYCGDNLEILRQSIETESIDLIYIDPPFNSKRDYNLFFDDKEIKAQRVAFEDTWTLKNVQDSLAELQSIETDKLYTLLMTYSEVAPFAFPYLVMMSLRILELHRVLKPTGSFYLHCDPTMSHYLKTVCDLVFGIKNFRNELIWHYGGWANTRYTQFSRKHDVIFFYSRTEHNTFHPITEPWEREEYLKNRKQKVYLDTSGKEYVWADGRKTVKRYIEQVLKDGKAIDTVWNIRALTTSSIERLGYPTQKPKTLLERIIQSSSNEGNLILDAFCGCGTTVDAAEGLHRQWIGIDISPISVNLVERRLRDTYGNELSKYDVRGLPIDKKSAEMLWEKNPFAFQDWWITEFEAFSSTFGTKGADKGIDGIALYDADGKGSTLRAAFQVKGGKNVGSKDIDALLGAMNKHKCELGVFLSSADMTKPMQETIALSGQVKVSEFSFPRLQSLTLEEFFQGKRPKLPSKNITFRQAKKTGKKKEQFSLW